MGYKVINIQHKDTLSSGNLLFFETGTDIDFEIKRVYYIVNVPKNIRRGAHAHKQLKQILFCPFGSIDISLDNGSGDKSVITLSSPDKAIILMPCIWRDMIWNIDNSVLCVAVSDTYDENDYIRNYPEFLIYVRENDEQKSTGI